MPDLSSAYDQLYRAIEAGEIAPETRLRETELAERFGVSRTPIREAIRKLESDGIVVHLPRIGAALRKLDQTEIIELYEMRIVTEATAARFAARHISDAELRALTDINAQIAESGGGPVTARLNKNFHGCILSAARNRYLKQSFDVLSHQFVLLGATTLESQARISEVCAQHSDIIAGLAAHDAEKAADAMATHMETSLDYRLRELRR